ncbi:hypothetical protein N0V84_011783 [Fusarium piperis]|uniref:IRG-type G domain-containing protein n=1 Tax=Fusarium piperis TaxID=1435070 RepID=A0A9W8TBA0_9HYPO|nr:hypothetical protein N0V84_011783 [Fusarium piperis]
MSDPEDTNSRSSLFSALGAYLGRCGRSVVAGAGILIGEFGALTMDLSQALLDWAGVGYLGEKFSAKSIKRDRELEGLDPNTYYVAVCGPAGSGKSSLLNALRGLLNKDQGAARVGDTETTSKKQEYSAAACFDDLCLVDFPGAGTQSVPAKGYFKANKLYCYDCILIICGERFGELVLRQIEIALVQACIVQRKRFAIVRSRSDETITRVEDDNGISFKEAKKIYIENQVRAITEELGRSFLPRRTVLELLGFFVLVNKNTLRRMTTLPPHDWPRTISEDEIHERKLLQFLGKADVTDEHVNPVPEKDE